MPDKFIVSSAIMQKVADLPRSMILVYLRMCYLRGCKEIAGHEMDFEYDTIKFTWKDMKGQQGLNHEGSFHSTMRALKELGVIKRVGNRPAKYKVW